MRLVLRWLPVVFIGVAVPCVASGQTKAAVAQQEAEAGKHYRAGEAAEKKGDWKKAYEEYAKAYELLQHPQILISLGVAEYRLGMRRAAAEHITLFLAHPPAGLPAQERAEYSRYLADVKKHVGTLKIFAGAGAEVTVGAVPVGAVPADGALEVFVDPGKPLVVARLGRAEGRQEAEVQPGKGSEVHLTLRATGAPAAPDAGPIAESERDAGVAANNGPAKDATPPATTAGGSVTAPGRAAVVGGAAPPPGPPVATSTRTAVITGGVVLAVLGAGVSVGTAVASFDVGREADQLADELRSQGGRGACRGVTSGDCLHLRELRGEQGALINTAILSSIGAGGVGIATGVYALVTRQKDSPATGTKVLPVVGQSSGGVVVVGTW